MSNLEQMPETLGRIRQEMSSLAQASADVWARLRTPPPMTLFSMVTNDIREASKELSSFNQQSKAINKLESTQDKMQLSRKRLDSAKARVVTLEADIHLSTPENHSAEQLQILQEARSLSAKQFKKHENLSKSASKQTESLRAKGINTNDIPAEKLRVQDQIQTTAANRQQSLELKGNLIGQKYKSRQQSVSQLKDVSASAKAFAQPKLELAKSLLKPGADLEAGLSEVQAMLHLNNGDPRTAALRQQSLSMAASGHAPSEVVAKQKALAESGMNADQVLAQTPAALNGATPAEQMAVTVKGDNLDGDITKLFASWDTIRINLFAGQSDALRQLTQTATGWLNTLNTWITDNPQMVNALLGLALGVTGLVSGLGFLGGVIAPVLSGVNMLMAGAGLLGTVFSGAGGIMAGAFAAVGGPVVALIAIIAGIAIVVAQLWEPIKAFVGGVIEGFTAAMGPVSDAFAPFKAALGWITDLFKPIEFTQETLNGVGDVGKKVGAAIAQLFVDLNEAFSQIGAGLNWLRKGIDSIFGLNKSDDKESSNSDSAEPNAPSFGDSAPSSGGALNLYQPARTNTSNSLTDNRSTTVNLSYSATNGADKDQFIGWFNEATNQREWNKTNDRLGQFGYGGMYS